MGPWPGLRSGSGFSLGPRGAGGGVGGAGGTFSRAFSESACGLLLAIVLLLTALPTSLEQDEDIPHNEVNNWALKFGVNLWEYGKEVTKMNEIQRKYREKETRVARKDGLLLIREMAEELRGMMESKMQAVLRIMDSAEQAALSHKADGLGRYEGRRSSVYSSDGRVAGAGAGAGSRDIPLRPSRHFDQLPVNTNMSSVMLAEGVSETDIDVANSIQWSELLDALFVNNYEMDPTLSWQYFGSSAGFIRRYPATKFPPEEYTSGHAKGSLHDFRSSQWYVSSASRPKDLVILVDSASSISSTKRELAILTARTILDTLGANDFVNVFRFADVPTEVSPCFKDMLAQATSANVRELKSALGSLRPEGSTNTTAALVTAFELLHRYNRTSLGCQCNQAIMLITDGPVQGSYKEVLKHYNWPHMPVRLFTYLLGKDSTTASELNKIACGNKGFFARISSKTEVRNKVLKYVSVMARPLIMYQNDHPVQWTSVYRGGKGSSLLPSEVKYGQLMTSVSAPVFDRRNYSERVANLLGVVGTDVPVEQIIKVVPPYKLGVNGYSFFVDNNGHVLYHPDLRPLQSKDQFQDTLKPEYNSVDLTEVELVDGEGGPRENNTILLDLRNDMIDQKEGESELTIKTHYQGMRVATRRNKYFYNPISNTPFSLALALPEGYGMYEALGEEEIKRSSVNLSECFKGDSWKVHPDWVYCEYNYATDHHFKSPEDQLLHFLNKVRKPGWKWMSQRHWTPQPGYVPPTKKLERDSYYCDKSLVQSLVFDAIITGGLDGPSNLKDERQLRHAGYHFFGSTLSFIATRSGLLRWQTLEEGSDGARFGDENRRAIDEVWYKRAVDQHRIEPESFVYSVPFDGGAHGKPLVTATHAVFVENKGHRAPAAVVGIQYQQSTLAAHFINITSTCTSKCEKNCASDDLDCYVLDNNGFIILSETPEEAGRFFGQVDGTIMDSLVQDRIYKKVSVYDYQGACSDSDSPYSAAPSRRIPTIGSLARSFGQWFALHAGWLAIQTQLAALVSDAWVAAGRLLHQYPNFADDDDYGSEGDLDEEEEINEEEEDVDESEDSDVPVVENDDGVDQYNSHTDVSNNVDRGESTSSGRHDNHHRLQNQDWDIPDQESQPDTDEVIREKEVPYSQPQPSPAEEEESPPEPPPPVAVPPPQPVPPPPALNISRARPCDKRVELYVLQPDRLNTTGQANPLKGKLTNCHSTGCERPFSVQKIPHSNLILLVVDTLCPCGSKQLTIQPEEVIHDSSSPCKGRNMRETLHRRLLPKCINYHPEETEIHMCGAAPTLTASALLLSSTFMLVSLVS